MHKGWKEFGSRELSKGRVKNLKVEPNSVEQCGVPA